MPARHRDTLGADCCGRFTLTKHPHGCLMIFPLSEWEKFRERIACLPMQAQWWKRIFLGNAMEVEMDATGRVLVSPELRKAAGISKDAVLLGMGNYFELWDAGRMQISCAKLARVDFSAAGMLLNWVSARQAEHRVVEFSEVNRLVAAFFNVIGIGEHAKVTARKD